MAEYEQRRARAPQRAYEPATSSSRRGVGETVYTPIDAHAYFARHLPRMRAVVERRGPATLPHHERLRWRPGARAALAAALGEPTLDQLARMIPLANPKQLIDERRGRVGELGLPMWNPDIGAALWFELARSLRASFARMVPRFLLQVDTRAGEPVTASDLVASQAIDEVVARLLCDPRALAPVAARSRARNGAADPSLFRDGLRAVERWRWLGERDRRLWNWVEVEQPRDATREEVALALNIDHISAAGLIDGTGPCFRVQPSLAAHAGARNVPSGDAVYEDDPLALAGSELAVDAAIAQAAGARSKAKPDFDGLLDTLERSDRQLERGRAVLVPWHLHDHVVAPRAFVARYREGLAGVSDARLGELAPVIEGQQELLFAAIGAIQQLAPAYVRFAAAGPGTPVARVIEAYALAIGLSHLVRDARAQLARAEALARTLTLDLLDESRRANEHDIARLREQEQEGRRAEGATAPEAVGAYRQRMLDLRERAARGESVDDDAALLAAELRLQALDTRIGITAMEAANVCEAIRASQSGLWPTLGTGLDRLQRLGLFGPLQAMKGPSLDDFKERIVAFTAELEPRVIAPLREARAAIASPTNVGRAALPQGVRRSIVEHPDPRERARQLDAARTQAEQALEAVIDRHALRRTLQAAVAEIQQQEIRTAVVKLAAVIAVSVAGGVAGAVAGSFVRGAMLADAAAATTGALRAANVAGMITGIVVDAGITTAGDLAIQGEGSFTETLLTNAAVIAALGPLQKAAAMWQAGDDVAKNLTRWQRTIHGGRVVLRKGVILTAEMLTAAAVSYAVERARHGAPPDDATAASWVLEGAAMAVGRFVSGQMTGLEQRLGALGEEAGHLVARARRIRDRGAAIEREPTASAALDALAAARKALHDEAVLIDDVERRVRAGELRAIAPELIATLRRGNQAERDAIEARAFAEMSLRLAGLEPDDASGMVWVGTTEQIAVALHQAQAAGLAVDVTDHDVAARRWRVRCDDRELTILETELRGRPREARPNPTDAERAQYRRYAEAATWLQERWEAAIKRDLESRELVAVDHLQIGMGQSGVISEATLPATGEGLGDKLVVYQHRGTLAGRGEQELGQSPRAWDAPGIRGSEQSAAGDDWITSDAHARSLAVGRLEVQVPAYRGTVIAIEPRPEDGHAAAEPWASPAHAWRAKVRSSQGKETWVYSQRIDNLGGPGPADLAQVRAVVEGDAQLAALLDAGLVLRGDDPDYASKLRGGRILVWGGTPTGAWAGEAARNAGAQASVIGDTRPPSTDWESLRIEYEAVLAQIAAAGSSVPDALRARKQAIEAQIAAVHKGMALPRNRKPGAVYEHGARGPAVEFGTPTRLTPAPGGGVLVTMGAGATVKTSRFDQVVIAHGQDPAAPTAPAGLLGPGAAKGSGDEVPAGTIALVPVYTPDGQAVLALESVDPPGLMLKGAAYASDKLAPWVVAEHRPRFVETIDRMKQEGAPTRDHGPVSQHSTGVITGIEHQRDKLPRANAIVAARAYRLPGREHTLVLSEDWTQWDAQVREFFAIELRADHAWVRVARINDGASGALLYHVWVDDHDVGVFKLFKGGGASNEVEMIELLDRAKLTILKVVRERGEIAVDRKAGYGSAMLMDTAGGTSVKQMIERLPDDPAARKEPFKELEQAVARVAQGLGELHAKFEVSSGRRWMTEEAKLDDANYFIERYFVTQGGVTKHQLGGDYEDIAAAVTGPAKQRFLDAQVPATVYLGDANAGNFMIDRDGSKLEVGLIDVGDMKWSVTGEKGKRVPPSRTGAADVARFLGSLETLVPGKLHAGELETLRTLFNDRYFAKLAALRGRPVDEDDYRVAELWYRLGLEFLVLPKI